jgi:hypothetical protein
MNKQIKGAELDVGKKLYLVKDWLLTKCTSRGVSPGLKIDHEVYYDGGDPSRMLELKIGHRTSIRVGVEKRDAPGDGRWNIGWTIFVDGRSVDEGIFRASQVEKMRTQLEQTLDTYLHLSQAFR